MCQSRERWEGGGPGALTSDRRSREAGDVLVPGRGGSQTLGKFISDTRISLCGLPAPWQAASEGRRKGGHPLDRGVCWMGLTQGPGRPENEAPAATPPERPAGSPRFIASVVGPNADLHFQN